MRYQVQWAGGCCYLHADDDGEAIEQARNLAPFELVEIQRARLSFWCSHNLWENQKQAQLERLAVRGHGCGRAASP